MSFFIPHKTSSALTLFPGWVATSAGLPLSLLREAQLRMIGRDHCWRLLPRGHKSSPSTTNKWLKLQTKPAGVTLKLIHRRERDPYLQANFSALIAYSTLPDLIFYFITRTNSQPTSSNNQSCSTILLYLPSSVSVSAFSGRDGCWCRLQLILSPWVTYPGIILSSFEQLNSLQGRSSRKMTSEDRKNSSCLPSVSSIFALV